MLYYRMTKLRANRLRISKGLLAIFILLIWSSWFICEIPLKKIPRSSSVVFRESMILSSPSDTEFFSEQDIDFTEPAVGVLSSPYGARWGRIHKGIDIAGKHGSEIVAAEKGVIKLAQWVSGYGNYIEIEHTNGLKTAYGHCDKLLVSMGDVVMKGQAIATMGNTGNSTGPHLHFEILLDEEPQNPLDYVIY